MLWAQAPRAAGKEGLGDPRDPSQAIPGAQEPGQMEALSLFTEDLPVLAWLSAVGCPPDRVAVQFVFSR